MRPRNWRCAGAAPLGGRAGAKFVLLAVAALAAAAVDAQSPAEFAYRLPLATPGDGAYYRVELPAAVYEGVLRSDLVDLRIFNGDGGAVPFAFLGRPGASYEAALPVPLPLFPLRVEAERRDLTDLALKLRRDAAGTTTLDLTTRDGAAVPAQRIAGYLVDAAEQKAPLAALTLPLPVGVNVTTRVRIDGSDDLVAWRTLVTGAPLVELEYGGRRLSRDRVELPGTTAKYLRITFETGQPAPELTAVRGEFADRIVDAPRQQREAAARADAAHPGDYEFDLGGVFPVDRVALELPEINTVAPAQVFARAGPKDEWRLVGTTVFYRLRQPDGEAGNPPLGLPVTPLRYWMVRVDPRSGGLGDKLPTLRAGWYPQALVFAARGNAPFELAYGSAQAKPAALAIETLVPGFDRMKTPATFATASVGAAKVAPAMAALRTPIDVKRWLLWATLGLATLVLGVMAYRLTRQMGQAPTQGPDAPPPPQG